MQVDVARLRMPTVSPQGMAVLEAINSQEVDLMEVADLTAKDPALTSTLLYLANSPMFRRRGEVSNARMAVSLLGAKRVRMAVMMTAMREVDVRPSYPQEVLWEHSLAMASLCRRLGDESLPLIADDLEMTGLLHDLGALVLIANFPKEYGALVEDCTRDAIVIEDGEREIFGGLDRGAVLQAMAERIHLPMVTRDALALFHSGEPMVQAHSDIEQHAAVLALAHHIDALVQQDTLRPPAHVPGDMASLALLLGLPDEEMDDLIEEYTQLLNQTVKN